ncbi:BnaC01g44730D [Brassica napus]|uniref:BnaC01g44730D protein n=1 Tax=Brassica napus TaxID=3708 RepID=A0A078IZD5_BRANA|nr:BnaC01g44730D [Brassica napus]
MLWILGPCKIISSPAPVFTLIDNILCYENHCGLFLTHILTAGWQIDLCKMLYCHVFLTERKVCILVTPASKTTFLPELCIGFGICVKVGCILLQ